MKIRLTTLNENSAGRPGFAAEWGLSFFVEADGQTVLFDTGASDITLRNVDRLGIKIPAGTPIVLSHGHADHTGGLGPVLRRIGKTRVIAHPAIWEKKFTQRPWEDTAADIGIPYERAELEHLGADFLLSTKPVRLSKNIWTTGEIPMVTEFESIEPIFPRPGKWGLPTRHNPRRPSPGSSQRQRAGHCSGVCASGDDQHHPPCPKHHRRVESALDRRRHPPVPENR